MPSSEAWKCVVGYCKTTTTAEEVEVIQANQVSTFLLGKGWGVSSSRLKTNPENCRKRLIYAQSSPHSLTTQMLKRFNDYIKSNLFVLTILSVLLLLLLPMLVLFWRVEVCFALSRGTLKHSILKSVKVKCSFKICLKKN